MSNVVAQLAVDGRCGCAVTSLSRSRSRSRSSTFELRSTEERFKETAPPPGQSRSSRAGAGEAPVS
eukprot:COSAG04_NODE_29481_length_268_cov_1.224852_1_plen_65_part_01